jgi:sec-independent protein translocase protein TatA
MFRSPLIDAIVVIVIVLLIFGPKRLPELGKGLGRGMREFKEGISGDSKDERAEPQALNSAPPPPANPPAANPSAAAGAEQVPSQNRGSAEVGSERQS